MKRFYYWVEVEVTAESEEQAYSLINEQIGTKHIFPNEVTTETEPPFVSYWTTQDMVEASIPDEEECEKLGR